MGDGTLSLTSVQERSSQRRAAFFIPIVFRRMAKHRRVTLDQWEELEKYHLAKAEENPERWFSWLLLAHRYHHGRYVISALNLIGDLIMARGKAKPQTASDKRNDQWTQFVNIPLTEDDYTGIEELLHDTGKLYQQYGELLLAGYRVSFAWNAQNQAVICSVTCRAEDDVNNGLTYTSFAGTWFEALGAALYKFYEVAHGNLKGASLPDARPRFG